MSKTTKKKSAKISKKLPPVDPSSPHEVAIAVKQILDNVRPTPMIHNGLSNEEKIEKITEKFVDIMETLGLDLSDDSLRETPRRVAKMYVNEVFSGLDPKKFPKMTVIENKMNYDQMIVVQNISCLSFCEHHFLPIDGFATVAYIPNKKVIGLSKINRIVQYFGRRPQVQERLTKQITDCLQYILGTEHVAVHINAKHYCVVMRGIEDTGSATATADLRGHFKTRMETREEFLQHCRTK
ncbi:GTP cyclohydrolase I FolE [Bdellovibrio sp. HCB117]|uniref:GTP cyclohydrolase I FolE n=1 Tax=Bdellovibrio sp. HCB117 TaxID=3394359 RepID=UPI0039B46AB3